MKSSRKLITILEYGFILTIIFNFRTVWLYTGNSNFSFLIRALGYASILTLIFMYLYLYRPRFSSRLVGWMLIPVITNTALSIWSYAKIQSSTLLLTNLYFDFALLLAYTAVHVRRFQELLRHFVQVMYWITSGSIIFWLAALFRIPTDSVISTNWATGYPQMIPGYLHVYFLSQGYHSFLGIMLPRNTIFFTEAPMAAFMIASALLVYSFMVKNSGRISIDKVQWILLIGIVTTGSTTGFLIAILTVTFDWLKNVRMSIVILVGALFVLPVLGTLVIRVLEQKQAADLSSVTIRMDDIHAGIQAWLTHPVLGYGLGQTRGYLEFIQPGRLQLGGNQGYSAGVLELLMTGGIVYLLQLVLVPLIVLAIHKKSFLFMGALFFTLLFNTVTYGTFMISFISVVFYGRLIEDAGGQQEMPVYTSVAKRGRAIL